MTIATKLRIACTLYLMLLGGISLHHVSVTRRASAIARDLADLAARTRTMASVLPPRIATMGTLLEKYAVSVDTGYIDRFGDQVGEMRQELQRMETAAPSREEREAIGLLRRDWGLVERDAGAWAVPGGLDRLRGRLDRQLRETERVAALQERLVQRQLAAASENVRDAERVSWLSGLFAILVGVAISALLARRILAPLRRLAVGTRAIAEGRFDHRLPDAGGDEIARVARDFNAMAGRLDALDRVKQELVSNASHDLKSPLASMLETTDVMLDGLAGPLTPRQQKLLSLSRESGRRLSAMIAKLLDLSRFDVTRRSRWEPVDVGAIAHVVVERAYAVRGTVELTLEDAPTVFGDSDAIATVLDNLIENARKFSPAGASIQVAIAPVGGEVEIRVTDSGPGVADADKERVFERFYQTAHGRAVRSRGAGLGLAICHRVVDSHGGRIWIEDNVPRGARFYVRLPAAQVGAVESPARLEEALV